MENEELRHLVVRVDPTQVMIGDLVDQLASAAAREIGYEEEVVMTNFEKSLGWAIRLGDYEHLGKTAVLYEAKTGPDEDGVLRAALLCFLPDDYKSLLNLLRTIRFQLNTMEENNDV